MQSQALVAGAVRTPIGRYGGQLREVRPDDLAALAIRALIERTRIPPELVDDVYLGCANQAGEDNRNVARMAALLAGLPPTVPAVTVNRLCGSGLEAINQAARAIWSGQAGVVIAGGVESMTRAPYILAKPEEPYPRGLLSLCDSTLGWRFVNPRLAERYPPLSLGETAERLADQYGITRQEQDEYALRSHQKAVAAADAGRFEPEIVPVPLEERGTPRPPVASDEGPRRETSLEKLAALRPAFRAGGTVTAGNSSQISDGAAAVLMLSDDRAKTLALRPLARVVDMDIAGVDPAVMGIGPVPATAKLLRRARLTLRDMDVVELNEAFAAQVLAVLREWDMDPADPRLNPNGGAIALGHPLGCSGARLVTTLIHELVRRRGRFGLASMCVGVGQGVATVFEELAAPGHGRRRRGAK